MHSADKNRSGICLESALDEKVHVADSIGGSLGPKPGSCKNTYADMNKISFLFNRVLNEMVYIHNSNFIFRFTWTLPTGCTHRFGCRKNPPKDIV